MGYTETLPLLPTTTHAGQQQRASRRRMLAAIAAVVAVGGLFSWILLAARSQNGTADTTSKRLSSPAVGRFLHITDLHVDPGYVEGATTYSQCHRKPPHITPPEYDPKKDGHALTGRFGIPQAKCDSPVALINATSEYLRREWAHKLDFVIWTGDSGRHDGDAELPRTFAQIVEGNDIAAAALRRAFKDIPVVPNIGNNDISPHNELAAPGHKRARKTFRALARSWHPLIPKDQLATFHYGGYFAKDVIDYEGSEGGGGITALSLNTIYWYRANAKVGGCRAKDSPGLAQLAWIRYQMRRARMRNRDIILLGHVLPNRDNYRPTCYHGYARTVTQTVPPPALKSAAASRSNNSTADNGDDNDEELPNVTAQLFGHSNVDVWAFVGQEAKWISSRDPLGLLDNSDKESAVDKRLWWEREVDEESGRFGKLIRDVWSNDISAQEATTYSTDDAAMNDTLWEDMVDDPPVHFAESADHAIVPIVNGSAKQALPSDFVETLLKEFKRVLVQNPQPPRLGVTTISPSIIPKYVPALRVFHYLRAPPAPGSRWWHLPVGTLLDYDVYWANIRKLNTKASIDISKFFKRLYRFSDVYKIDDLSIDSYLKWAERLLSSKPLRKQFRSLTYLNTQ
ncbi:Endopolyphosphatase [Coemansia erecta]|nr:Endopolyphosphatase [Coemansia erecta]